MGFLKRNWEKITSDTISGVFVRLVAFGLFGFGGIYIGNKLVSSQIASDIIKDILTGIFIIVIMVIFILALLSPLILEWLSYVRDSKIKEKELDNEKLELEIELEKQKQQSPPDQEE